MAKTLPMHIDVTDVAGVRDRLRWAAETIGNLRRENEQLRSALAAQPQPGPWPKFCPWCMAEFHADGTVTPPEAVAGSATPEEDDNG